MKSINLVKAAKELQNHLENIAHSHSHLPAKPREFIETTSKQVAEIILSLQKISDNYVDLTSVSTGDGDLQRNARHWDSLQPGQIAGTTLEELVKQHSTTLKTLYQGAIDVRQISKFSEAELVLARDLGDDFSVHKAGWGGLKIALAKKDGHVLAKASDATAVRKFFTLLKHRAVIVDFKILTAKFQSQKQTWAEADFDRLRHLPPNHPLRIEISGLENRYHSFLTGHWFNAYAYAVFEDQLKRLESDFEIYPRVHFVYSNAGRRTQGDFDVIINIGKRLLLVESKSGRISQDRGHDDYAAIVQKTELLKDAFRSTRIADYTFLLMFNPDANEPEKIRDFFGARDIEAVTPSEIRGIVIDKIRGLPLPSTHQPKES